MTTKQENQGERLCTLCGETFHSEAELRDHERKVHSVEARRGSPPSERGEKETAHEENALELAAPGRFF